MASTTNAGVRCVDPPSDHTTPSEPIVTATNPPMSDAMRSTVVAFVIRARRSKAGWEKTTWVAPVEEILGHGLVGEVAVDDDRDAEVAADGRGLDGTCGPSDVDEDHVAVGELGMGGRSR